MASILTQPASHSPSPEALRYLSFGNGETAVVFLHGLFGSPQHWLYVMGDLADRFRVVAPHFPIDHRPGRRTNGVRSIAELTDYVECVWDEVDIDQAILVGNSLGGLVSIDFSLRHPDKVLGLVLTGSAGLFEYNLTGGARMQADRDFIRERACEIFYDPKMVTDDIVDSMFHDLQDRDYVRFVLRMAKATRNRYVRDELDQIKVPSLLVWGREDQITPPSVAEEFNRHLANSELVFLDRCGHSPNLERPEVFSAIVQRFLADSFSFA